MLVATPLTNAHLASLRLLDVEGLVSNRAPTLSVYDHNELVAGLLGDTGQAVAVSSSGGELLGIVAVIRPDYASRRAYLGFVLVPSLSGHQAGDAIVAACEVVRTWEPWRLLLVEMDERQMLEMEGGFRGRAELQGVLKEHFFAEGEYRNLAILAVMNGGSG